jgi:tRNA(Ile)-lysidine synthase
VHVNHGLRGAAARRDELFVARLCTRLGVAWKVYSPEVRKTAVDRKWSLEEAGRKLRQESFLSAAREFKAQAVLLAHHRDDQVETVLFNFLRGSGARGLGGMLPARAFPHAGAPAGLKLLRPLLGVPKADLAAYCRQQHLGWRHDQSNEDTGFTRNRLRRRLLPWLEKNLNPGVRSVLARAAESTARDEAWLESEARRGLRACRPRWSQDGVSLEKKQLVGLAEPLRIRVLSLVWDQLGIPGKSQAHLLGLEQAVLGFGPPARHLPGTWRLQPGVKTLGFFRTSGQEKAVVAGNLSHSCAYGVHIQNCRVPAKAGRVGVGSSFIYVDAEKITGALSCRPRRVGDLFKPLGLGGRHKELKKVLAEMHIPIAQRADWPLVVMGNEIVWVYQGPMAERFKLTAVTRKALKITLEPR